MATGLLGNLNQYNPLANLTQQTFKPETAEIDFGKETVQGQVQNLISQDNPLMQQARAKSQMQAAGRGLLNSSIAAGAGTAAMLDQAAAIGKADADIYGRRAEFNLGAKNAAGQFNAQQNNALMGQGLGIAANLYAQKDQQQFNADQNLAQRDFQGAQADLDRLQQRYLQTNQQEFTAGQSTMDRQQQLEVLARQQGFQGSQAELDRAQQLMLADKNITAQQALQRAQQEFQGAQSDLDRAQQLSVLASQQAFQGGQATLDRAQQILIADKQITAQQALQQAQQEFQTTESQLNRQQQTSLQTGQQTFQTAQAELDRSLQTNLASMSQSMQLQIANINKDYAQLSQLSSTAASLYSNFSSAAQQVLVSDLTPRAKEAAINQMATLMTGGMQIQGSILGDVDMTTLIGQIFGSAPVPPAPGVEPTPAPTPTAANWSAYLQQNPDVQASYNANSYGMTPEQFAQAHYQNYGQAEGRVVP